MPTVVVDSINCPKCGAPLKPNLGEIIVVCEYCSSAILLSANSKYVLRHSLIPAGVNEEEIRQRIAAWMKGGFYKPDDLAKKAKLEKLECTYLPFFVFEVYAKMTFTGVLKRTGEPAERKGAIEKTMLWKVLGRRESRFPTMEYKIPLAGKVQFSIGAMVKGSSFLNAEMDEQMAAELAKGQIHSHMLQLTESSVDEVKEEKVEYLFKNTEFVHAPIWRALYEYKGSFYKMYLDGATGDTIRSEVPPPDTSLTGLVKSVVDA